MMQQQTNGNAEADIPALPFLIRRMDTSGYVKPSDPLGDRLPFIGFVYVISGEVLMEVDGTPFLCQPGQLLLIPPQTPFVTRYYRDAVGYTGGFAPSLLADTQAVRFLPAPVHQGFWFDEGAFMGELFNMLAISYEKGDGAFLEKGLDLLLSRVRPTPDPAFPAAVTRFLEAVFNPGQLPLTIASYAEAAGISGNYLSRLVKKCTGRSVGAWIDIVRIQRAKRLLTSTTLPIIDIAAAVGVDDQSYFSRLFRKATGMTPSAFRKAMQG